MKKSISILIISLFFASYITNAQQLNFSNDDIEVQLIEIIGDSTAGTLRPVLRFRPKNNDKNYLAIKHPRAWNRMGIMHESKEQYEEMGSIKDPIYIFNGDNDVWSKINCDEYFRIEGWNRKNNSVSVLTIDYLCDMEYIYLKKDYKDIYRMMIFYDVPITWKTPSDLPTKTAEVLGVKPLGNTVGVYHPYTTNGKAFDGTIRLESVYGNVKTGELRFLLQVKSNGASKLYSEAITIKYKGALITLRDNTSLEYAITPQQWTEIAIVGRPGFFIHPDTKEIEYIELEIGSGQNMGIFEVNGKVPINWIDPTAPTSASTNGNNRTQGGSYILTEKGVGPLQLGKKFPLPTPKGTFYTSAKKKSADKYSGVNYGLYIGNKMVGSVTTNFTTQAINEITIETSAVKTENGIAVGTKVREALGKNGVKAEIEYYYDSNSWYITFRYGNIVLVCDEEDYGLTPEAYRKIRDGFFNGNPIFDLPANFFSESATISGIIVSIQ